MVAPYTPFVYVTFKTGPAGVVRDGSGNGSSTNASADAPFWILPLESDHSLPVVANVVTSSVAAEGNASWVDWVRLYCDARDAASPRTVAGSNAIDSASESRCVIRGIVVVVREKEN